MEMLLLMFGVGFVVATLLFTRYGHHQTHPEIRYIEIETAPAKAGGCLPTLMFAGMVILVVMLLGSS